MVKQVELDYNDLEIMTIGMILDYIDEYVEQKRPENEKVRTAKQSDMDSF